MQTESMDEDEREEYETSLYAEDIEQLKRVDSWLKGA